jgi:uncharacterized phosphosugar-binding protein
MGAQAYFEAVQARIFRLGDTQLPAIEEAGQAVANAIAADRRIWIARTSHTLHDEGTYRAGGLMAVHVLHDAIAVEAGDVVIAGTNAGTHAPYIDLAQAVRARGGALIVLTQVAFERDPGVVLAHPSGHRLSDYADILIDLGGEAGDGEFTLLDTGLRVLPSSGVTGVLALWMIFAEAMDRLIDQGMPPLFWQAIQIPGAVEANAERLRAYHQTGKGYQSLKSSSHSGVPVVEG